MVRILTACPSLFSSVGSEYHNIRFHFEDPGGTGSSNSSAEACMWAELPVSDVSLSTHSVLPARESTQGPAAEKRKRGRPRKVVNVDGKEPAAPQLLGKNASNLEIPQVSSEATGSRKIKPVSLLLAYYYKRYL